MHESNVLTHGSNALRRLEELLTEAVTNGDGNELSGLILLRAMKLSEQPQNIVDFCELLSKAEEEAKSIRNKTKIDRYIQTLEELHKVFVVSHIWSTQWAIFAGQINNNILNTLDSLADLFDKQNPAIFLDQEFLEKLKDEFSDLLTKILESDLSRDLKIFLRERIEDILRAIRRYPIDGTEGLEKATKSFVSDLAMTEHSLQEKDKDAPIYRRVKAFVLSSIMYTAPIIGAIPDIDGYWRPKFEELVAGHEKVEKILCESPNIQEAFEKSSKIFDRQPQKIITGNREPKALPASKQELETNTNNKSNP